MLIVSKLILIYFTWFVHNFVNYKCNVLKRNDACLMPLSTFMCVHVCVCVCVCACMRAYVRACVFHVHSWRRPPLSRTVRMSGNRSTMLYWRRFFPPPSPFTTTLEWNTMPVYWTTWSSLHIRSGQSHKLTRVHLACQRLDSILKYFCNSLWWQEGNQNCP